MACFSWVPRGRTASGGGVAITAAGGIQTIQVLLAATPTALFQQGLRRRHIDDKVAKISSVTPPNVIVSGESAGATSLRLLESGSTRLLDRVSINVGSIDKVTVFPRELFLVAEDDGTPWALLSGAKARLVVQLKAANGDRLVDEKLSLKSVTGPVTAQAWDLFEITAPDADAASFTIEAGKGSFTAKAAVVAAIDAIESSRFLNQLGEGGTLEAAQDQLLCFVGKSGGVPTPAQRGSSAGHRPSRSPPETRSSRARAAAFSSRAPRSGRRS